MKRTKTAVALIWAVFVLTAVTASAVTKTISRTGQSAPAILAVKASDKNDDFVTEAYTKVGDEIVLYVKMNGTVTVALGSTPPELALNVLGNDGAGTRFAQYWCCQDEYIWFRYEVQPGDFIDHLDIFDRDSLDKKDAIIKVDGEQLTNFTVPVNTDDGSLKRNAQISIRTICLDSTRKLTGTITGMEYGEPATVKITRDGALSDSTAFTITFPNGGADKVGYSPNPFAIPSDESDGDLEISFLDSTADPILMRIHPNCYGTVQEGDIVLTINIAEGPPAPVYINGPIQLEEGQGNAQFSVVLTRTPKEATTVSISASPPGIIEFLSSTSLTWGAGDTTTNSVTVRPLDGNANVTLTATPDNRRFCEASFTTFVENVNPSLANPSPEWEPPTGTEGVPYTFAWSGSDVDADMDTLYAVVQWGDGTTNEYNGAQGTASHMYTVPGDFGITVALHDKDGGIAIAAGPVKIVAATRVFINEYKVKLSTDVGQNNYLGLNGLGRGTVDDTLPLTVRQEMTPSIDYVVKYPQTTSMVTFLATPEAVTLPGVDYDGNPGEYSYDSFLHVWSGEEGAFVNQLNCVPLSASSPAAVRLGDGTTASVRQIGAVFSRERYPDDNCADIDGDGLPDRWEQIHLQPLVETEGKYAFESAAGDFGGNGNPDADYLPAGSVENGRIVYPLPNYSPTGVPYSNEYEVRGIHPGLNALNSDPVAPQDEPHRGVYDDNGIFTDTDSREFYGTDPNNSDTDADGLPDGWEYYWWRVGCEAAAGNLPGASFLARDPRHVGVGVPIAPEEIVRAFHPLVPGSMGADLDGDGISNYEEFILGTNPCHWDSDGDGLGDRYEISSGRSPFEWDAPFSLEEAVDTTTLVLKTGGAAGWSAIEYIGANDGMDCARSGDIGTSDVSWIEAEVRTGGTMSFSWRTTCEKQGATLILIVDGDIITRLAGNNDWQRFSLRLGAGLHTIRWQFKKGRGGDADEDCAWLDQLVWEPQSSGVDFGTALDAPTLAWSTGGAAEWVPIVSDAAFDNEDCAVSGAIGDNLSSWLSTEVFGPGTLSFDWRVSSEYGYDWYDFQIDGVCDATLTGESGWRHCSVVVPEGRHVLKWVYSKDDMDEPGKCGEDIAALDCVSWTPENGRDYAIADGHPEIHVPFTWLDRYPAALSTYGGNYDMFCNATAANGVNKVWECYVAGLDPTDSSEAFLVHIAVANGVTSITWTPDLGDERIYTIFGREALETGEWITPTNSASKFFKVKVALP